MIMFQTNISWTVAWFSVSSRHFGNQNQIKDVKVTGSYISEFSVKINGAGIYIALRDDWNMMIEDWNTEHNGNTNNLRIWD